MKKQQNKQKRSVRRFLEWTDNAVKLNAKIGSGNTDYEHIMSRYDLGAEWWAVCRILWQWREWSLPFRFLFAANCATSVRSHHAMDIMKIKSTEPDMKTEPSWRPEQTQPFRPPNRRDPAMHCSDSAVGIETRTEIWHTPTRKSSCEDIVRWRTWNSANECFGKWLPRRAVDGH